MSSVEAELGRAAVQSRARARRGSKHQARTSNADRQRNWGRSGGANATKSGGVTNVTATNGPSDDYYSGMRNDATATVYSNASTDAATAVFSDVRTDAATATTSVFTAVGTDAATVEPSVYNERPEKSFSPRHQRGSVKRSGSDNHGERLQEPQFGGSGTKAFHSSGEVTSPTKHRYQRNAKAASIRHEVEKDKIKSQRGSGMDRNDRKNKSSDALSKVDRAAKRRSLRGSRKEQSFGSQMESVELEKIRSRSADRRRERSADRRRERSGDRCRERNGDRPRDRSNEKRRDRSGDRRRERSGDRRRDRSGDRKKDRSADRIRDRSGDRGMMRSGDLSAVKIRRNRTDEERNRGKHGEEIETERDMTETENESTHGQIVTPGAVAVFRGTEVLQDKGNLYASYDNDDLHPVTPSSARSHGGNTVQEVHSATVVPPKRKVREPPASVPAERIVEETPKAKKCMHQRLTRYFIVGTILAVFLVVILSVVLTREGKRITLVVTLSPTPAPTSRSFDPTRLPALVSRLGNINVPFSLTSQASQFALDWIANVDEAFLSIENADETQLLQRFALAAFYNATDGPNWVDQCNFLSAANVCEWHCESDAIDRGIYCENEDVVVSSMLMASNNLRGSLPGELQALTNVDRLWIFGNGLSGDINLLFRSLKKLRSINLLSNSQISGTIGTEIGTLSNLELLQIGPSRLEGTLPQEIQDLSNLIVLNLQVSKLRGTIPDLSLLSALKSIDLGVNFLTGSIPTEMGALSSLTELSLYDNRLEGTVPREVASLSELSIIRLRSNKLVGNLDPVFCTIDALPSITVFETDCNSDELTCTCCTACRRRLRSEARIV